MKAFYYLFVLFLFVFQTHLIYKNYFLYRSKKGKKYKLSLIVYVISLTCTVLAGLALVLNI
ncbi:hypothetical protein MH1LPH_00950 [Lactiplantibacillus brownii]